MNRESSIRCAGICSFEITDSNNRYLRALTMYTRMIDLVCADIASNGQEPHEPLNADGLINAILDDAFKSKVRELVKRHGFGSENEFVELIGACADAKDVLHIVRNAENNYYIKQHRIVLEQIPVEDRQRDIDFEAAQ